MPPGRAADPRPRGARRDPRGWLRGWRAGAARRRAGLRAGPPGVVRGRDAAGRGRGPGRGRRGAPGCRGRGGWHGGWRLCSCCWPCWPPAACSTAGLAPRPGPAGTALPGPGNTAPPPRRVSCGKRGSWRWGCRRYPAMRRWSICLATRRRSAAPAALLGMGMGKAGCAAEQPRTGGMQRSLQCWHPRERCWTRCGTKWATGRDETLATMGCRMRWDAACWWFPGGMRCWTLRAPGGPGLKKSPLCRGHAIRRVQQLEDTRLTSHPHRDQQPRSCCSPPCCGLDKKRAELPRALLQWLPHAGSESWVSRMSREPAQTKVAARDNVCIGGSWLWDITSCMMTSLRYNDVKGCLHLSLHPDHNVISTTPRAQPARAIIPQGWEQEAGAAGAYSSHNPQHLYRAFHFSSRQTKESNLHCLLIKRWHPLAPCSLFSWGSWDWGEAFFVFFRGQAAQKSVQSPKEREAVKKNLFTQISTGPMWAL